MSFLTITSSDIGKILAWVVLAGFGITTFVFVYLFIPETKDKSLEAIIALFEKKSSSNKLV
jgi:hypothetical protein